MDIGRSFTYIFEDKDWLKKVLIGGLVNLVPIVNFAATGYAIETLRRAKEGEEPVLPEWSDFGDFFSKGLILLIGMIILSIPAAILIMLSGGLAVFYNGFQRFNTFFSGTAALIVLIVFIYFLFLFFAMPAIFLNYAKKLSFSSIFEFSEFSRIIFSDLTTYILCLVNIFLAYVLSAIIAGIPWLGVVLSVFAYFYAMLVMAGAVAQLWISKEVQEA